MALLLVVCAALLTLLLAAIGAGAGGEGAAAHPAHGSMLRAGTEGGMQGAPRWAGLVAGLSVIGVFGIALFIGFRNRGWIRYAAAAWTAGYALVFAALLRSAEAYRRG
ncbi:MAG: hypothetical protein R3266_12240 [Gemmatimonadota bacterium]|nr:hypothetical protein [Gemmatimonadota bacterium]